MAKLYCCDTSVMPGYGNRLWIKESIMREVKPSLAKLSMWGDADKRDDRGTLILSYEMSNENLEKARKLLNDHGFKETQNYKEIGLE